MTERPILFSAPMVRAILAGTKTQTRRVAPIRELNIVKHPGDLVTWSVSFLKAIKGVLSSHSGGKFTDLQARSIIASQFCPYGKPGDRLWVREAFMHEPADYCWEASVSIPCTPASTSYRADFGDEAKGAGWKPSIHMPRALSRITLEITGVRVERLQAISDQDAKAEGAEPREPVTASGICIPGQYRLGFRDLWESINGPGSWDANPWVWVVEFKRVQP